MKVHALKLKNISFNEETGLYVAAAIRKVVEGNYTYGKQLSSSDLRKHNIGIMLPITGHDSTINYPYMQTYISAIKKLAIAGVVKWKDRELAALRQARNLA